MGLSTETANLWVDRWERQQQRYAIDREERFTVIADVVEHVTQGRVGRPLVVDLGCGPGCLSDRLARRLPRADIVGADMDPLLLELARARHGRAVRYVETVLGRDGWIEDSGTGPATGRRRLHHRPALPPAGGPAHASTRRLAEVIRPGGVLVNGDHLAPGQPRPPPPSPPTSATAAPSGRALSTHEEWDAWWDAVPVRPRPRRTCSPNSVASGRRRPSTATTTCRFPGTSNCCARAASPTRDRSGSSAPVTCWSPSAEPGTE